VLTLWRRMARPAVGSMRTECSRFLRALFQFGNRAAGQARPLADVRYRGNLCAVDVRFGSFASKPIRAKTHQ
jgi:hypothetical protein